MINATFEDLRLGKMQDGPTIKSCRGRGGLVEVRNHSLRKPLQTNAQIECWRGGQDITFRRVIGDGTALTPPPVGAGQAWPQLWLRMVYPCADPNVSRCDLAGS